MVINNLFKKHVKKSIKNKYLNPFKWFSLSSLLTSASVVTTSFCLTISSCGGGAQQNQIIINVPPSLFERDNTIVLPVSNNKYVSDAFEFENDDIDPQKIVGELETANADKISFEDLRLNIKTDTSFEEKDVLLKVSYDGGNAKYYGEIKFAVCVCDVKIVKPTNWIANLSPMSNSFDNTFIFEPFTLDVGRTTMASSFVKWKFEVQHKNILSFDFQTKRLTVNRGTIVDKTHFALSIYINSGEVDKFESDITIDNDASIVVPEGLKNKYHAMTRNQNFTSEAFSVNTNSDLSTLEWDFETNKPEVVKFNDVTHQVSATTQGITETNLEISSTIKIYSVIETSNGSIDKQLLDSFTFTITIREATIVAPRNFNFNNIFAYDENASAYVSGAFGVDGNVSADNIVWKLTSKDSGSESPLSFDQDDKIIKIRKNMLIYKVQSTLAICDADDQNNVFDQITFTTTIHNTSFKIPEFMEGSTDITCFSGDDDGLVNYDREDDKIQFTSSIKEEFLSVCLIQTDVNPTDGQIAVFDVKNRTLSIITSRAINEAQHYCFQVVDDDKNVYCELSFSVKVENRGAKDKILGFDNNCIGYRDKYYPTNPEIDKSGKVNKLVGLQCYSTDESKIVYRTVKPINVYIPTTDSTDDIVYFNPLLNTKKYSDLSWEVNYKLDFSKQKGAKDKTTSPVKLMADTDRWYDLIADQEKALPKLWAIEPSYDNVSLVVSFKCDTSVYLIVDINAWNTITNMSVENETSFSIEKDASKTYAIQYNSTLRSYQCYIRQQYWEFDMEKSIVNIVKLTFCEGQYGDVDISFRKQGDSEDSPLDINTDYVVNLALNKSNLPTPIAIPNSNYHIQLQFPVDFSLHLKKPTTTTKENVYLFTIDVRNVTYNTLINYCRFYLAIGY